MPQPIQRQPVGLLSFLGLKGQGVNPHALGDLVSPVVDITPNYLAGLLEGVSIQAPNVTAVLDGAVLQVPNGEAWNVVAAGIVAFGLSATEVVDMVLSVGVVNPVSTPLIRQTHTVVNAADQIRFGILTPGLVLPPGSTISGILLRALTVGSADVEVHALIHRLSV